MDLFGSDSFNPLALALVDPPTTFEVDPPSAGPTFSATSQASIFVHALSPMTYILSRLIE